MALGLVTDGWKTTVDDYVASAKRRLGSMQRLGFLPQRPIPVDVDGELLDGSHRVACALALQMGTIPVEQHPGRRVFAPAWGEAWFVENGMVGEDLERLQRDYASLTTNVDVRTPSNS